MNNPILARAGWFAVLSHAALIPASASAQSTSPQLGARSEATIQIRVSVAPRFTTSNRVTSEAGRTNVTSNAPGLRYTVIAQQPQGMTEGGLQDPGERTQSGPLSTLLLIVPD